MRNRTLLVPVVVVALVAVGAAGAVVTADSTASEPAATGVTAQETAQSQTITVSGDGSASATPDRAVIRVAVVAEGNDPAAIRQDLSSGAEDLRDALSDAGVDADRLSTEDYAIRERHRRPDSDRERAYRGEHAFEITLDDTDAVGSVVDAAADSGAEISDVRFTLSEESRTELRDEALQHAMADARQQADTLATAGDLSVTGVASIDATSGSYSPVRYQTEAADLAGGGTTIETGDASVSVSVRVAYNATDA